MAAWLATWLAACLLALVQPAVVLAQATAFDNTFSGNGELEDPFPVLPSAVTDRVFRSLALDHAENIYLAGREETMPGNSVRSLYLGRLLGNGQADASYGSSGVRAITYSAPLYVRDLLVRPDGSALLCAAAEDTSRLLGITPEGQFDAEFAADEVVPGNRILDGIQCETIDTLSDGRIVMMATDIAASPQRAVVLVFDAQGNPDPTFGSNGRQVLSLGFPSAGVQAVEQPGLGLLVAAAAQPGAEQTGAVYVLRLTYNGSLDEGFGPIITPLDTHVERVQNGGQFISVLPDGELQLGIAQKFSVRARLQRWAANGQGGALLDDPFGSETGNNDEAFLGSLAVGPDGLTYVASLLQREPQDCPRLQHYQHLTRRLRAGGGDGSFASQGIYFWYPLQPLFDFADCAEGVLDVRDVALQRNGRILVLTAIQQDLQLPLVTRLQGQAFGTPPWDLQPEPMSFPAATARPNALTISNVVVVNGLGSGIQVPAYVLGEGAELSINYGPYRNVPSMVKNGDVLRLRQRAPALDGASAVASLFVGGLRGHNGWAALGPREQADFTVTSSLPSLPGIRCSSSGLNSNCNAAIPDEGSVESTINFINDGSCGFVGGVRVGVDLEHSYVGDLRLTLTDPNGQVFIGGSEGIVSLLNRPRAAGSVQDGSCSLDDVLTTFDDEALAEAHGACGAPLAQPALSGELQSKTALSELFGRRTTGSNGAASSGVWTLKVEDLANGDTGQLNDWSLEVQCLASAPALSDLSVEASGPPEVVAGSSVNLSWTVTNLGPSATSNGRFRASLPAGLSDALDNPAWGCSTSAGGSCTPAISCFGACLGSEIDIGFGLPNGGTMTVFATGTLTPLASGNLSIGARVSTPLAIGGSRDANPDNDQAQYLAAIERETDLAISSMSHHWTGQSVEVQVVVSNLGPSLADGFSGSIDLPDGLVVNEFRCERGQLGCSGNLSLSAGNVLDFSQVGLFANSTPLTYVVVADWAGSDSPGSVTAQLQADANASDPVAGNDQDSQELSAPSAGGPVIFADGFE